MELKKKLAMLQANIWFLYDAKKFIELSNTASKLFSTLGISNEKSILAGKHVSNAHLFYENAVKENNEGNKIERDKYFKKALNEQIKIREILGEDIRAAYCENMWWKHFHYGNYLRVFLIILRQQIIMYKGYNLLIPLRATYYLVRAGIEGHNKRNINVTAKYLEKYWEIVLAHMKDKIQY